VPVVRRGPALSGSHRPYGNGKAPRNASHAVPAGARADGAGLPSDPARKRCDGVCEESHLPVNARLGSAAIVFVVRRAAIVTSAAAATAVALACAGCGSGLDNDAPARASVASRAAGTCGATVLEVLGRVAMRVYHEGVESERELTARHLIARSGALSGATERNDAAAARAAVESLLATRHMVGLRVMRGGTLLAKAGVARGLAPLSGAITGAGGRVVGSYEATVWGDHGLVDETRGLTGASIVVREGTRELAGSVRLPARELPAQGTVTLHGVAHNYFSFPATAYPDGRPLRVYVTRAVPSSSSVCGTSVQSTIVNVLRRVARQIYRGEAGPRALAQVRRVQGDPLLLRAVALRDPAAARWAIESLLHQHLVRLRVSAGGALLADVGGPYVLAPVSAPLRVAGRTVGRAVLSVQDDQGYLRLAKRLAGLDVLMYMGSKLVQSSLGEAPPNVPTSGPFSYRGHSYVAFSLQARAFPSGPLRVTLLVPTPYG
jgi:hypothetical protein